MIMSELQQLYCMPSWFLVNRLHKMILLNKRQPEKELILIKKRAQVQPGRRRLLKEEEGQWPALALEGDTSHIPHLDRNSDPFLSVNAGSAWDGEVSANNPPHPQCHSTDDCTLGKLQVSTVLTIFERPSWTNSKQAVVPMVTWELRSLL